jgi:hypothetical protein
VSTLNKEMTKLNKETVKITQQNALNAKSTSGVYLLPGSNTPARLNSQIGTLRMSLKDITPNATARGPRCAFRGVQRSAPGIQRHRRVGTDQGTTQNYQEVNVQNQLISAPASTLAPSDVDIRYS